MKKAKKAQKKRKALKSKLLDYQAAKFMWALAQIVPDNARILKEARRTLSWDPVVCWSVDVWEFIETYEEKHGPVKKASNLPPELTDYKFIPISDCASIFYTPGEAPHSQN